MRYYLIADPNNTGELELFLKDEKIAWRPDPKVSWAETVMEFAGRLCYNSWEQEDGTYVNQNLTTHSVGNMQYIKRLIEQGHTSVLEHTGPLTFVFAHVSRVFTHELVRHRAGCAYSQTSGRYVRSDAWKLWKPAAIANNKKAVEYFFETENYLKDVAKQLEDCFPELQGKDFAKKKEITSAIRRILPNGMSNHIIMSTNHRALRHIINMRAADGAEEEIRLIFRDVLRRVKGMFPAIYQDMEER